MTSGATSAATEERAASPGSNVESLWTVEDCAQYLNKSVRWVYEALKLADNMQGSIPHVRLPPKPGQSRSAARFMPALIRQWTLANCPPASVFMAWSEQQERHRRKTNVLTFNGTTEKTSGAGRG
jgi:hypothetical protein